MQNPLPPHENHQLVSALLFKKNKHPDKSKDYWESQPPKQTKGLYVCVYVQLPLEQQGGKECWLSHSCKYAYNLATVSAVLHPRIPPTMDHVVCTIEKHPCTSGPMQFKPMLFKGQLHTHTQTLKSYTDIPRNISGLVLDHHKKANIAIKWVTQMFWFPSAYKS